MKEIRIIANYLPQFHVIPENDNFWGAGFTDWVAVKTAKPLFKGHWQPRVPLDNHYYSLDDEKEIRWQAELAKKYKVYGFAMYHYWFSSKQNLLKKPAEILLHNKDIDIHFMFIWDNASWKRSWSKEKFANDWTTGGAIEQKCDDDRGILAELIYGGKKEWKEHFMYLLPFFLDKRYITLDGKPMFGVFQPGNKNAVLLKMCSYWHELAKENGLPGIVFLGKDGLEKETMEKKFQYAPFELFSTRDCINEKIKKLVSKMKGTIKTYDYDDRWKHVLKYAKKASNDVFLSGFVDYDDTPRRPDKTGALIKGATPKKFGYYLRDLLNISKEQGKEYLFITAWNEWGEGAYLEPDKRFMYAYLEELNKAVAAVNGEKYD